MKQTYRLLALVLTLVALSISTTLANVNTYRFAAGTGNQIPNLGRTLLWSALPMGALVNQVQTQPIGFTFVFDGTSYTQFSLSTNGLIGLGPVAVTSSGANNLATVTGPVIAPWWDQMRLAGGGGCWTPDISMYVSGVAPNRVLLIDYKDIEIFQIQSNPTRGQFQVRLYETSNRIEVWYGIMTSCGACQPNGACGNTSASIGIANGAANFMSVTPGTPAATASTVTANNAVNLQTTPIAAGTVYSFDNCQLDLATNPGGTAILQGGAINTGLQTRNVVPFTFQPFSVGLNGTMGCAPRTYTFSSSNPEFTVAAPVGPINAGQTLTPTVTFRGVPPGGLRTTNITVTDNLGFARTFSVSLNSGDPLGVYTTGAGMFEIPAGPGFPLFRTAVTCIGEQVSNEQLTIRNTGPGTLNITSADFFEIDSVPSQGANPPLKRIGGRLVRSGSYQISDAATVNPQAPLPRNQPLQFPIAIPQGGSRVFNITMVGQIAGRRLARLFLRTDDLHHYNQDTNAATTFTYGLFTIDLVGTSVGGSLARNAAGSRLDAFVFPDTRVGDTVTMAYPVVNSGACILRISRRQLSIFSGDVREFQIVRAFPGRPIDQVTNDYLLNPGDTSHIVFRFTPTRSGGRLATMRMQTNDSSLVLPGLFERGSYYIDLHGRGRAGLDVGDVVLNPVLVGSFVDGVVLLENTSIAAIEIGKIILVGGDSAQFGPVNWPSLPTNVLAGSKLGLGIRMTPSGPAGTRRTTMLVITTGGDTIRVRIRGEAGTQELLVTPLSLFENDVITTGNVVRRTITISNNGTLPIRLQQPKLTGIDSLSYLLGSLPRLDLAPGQTEYLQVTYAPSTQGQHSAQVEIRSNASNPLVIVTLGGTATRARHGDDDDASTARGSGGPIGYLVPDVTISGPDVVDGTSGITGESSTGVTLDQSTPNPASGTVEIGYSIRNDGDVRLELVDQRGMLVSTLAEGTRAAGRHTVRFDVASLPAGLYHYRLTTGAQVLTRSLHVVR